MIVRRSSRQPIDIRWSCWDGAQWTLANSPPALWLLFFSNAFLTSFPLIPMADWLNNHIQMPVATQSQFYACIFIPYCFKPLYAFLIDALGKHPLLEGRTRACLLQLSGVVSCLLFVSTLAVDSVQGAFAVFFVINVFDACAELMLSSYLMDLAHLDLENAGVVQAFSGLFLF